MVMSEYNREPVIGGKWGSLTLKGKVANNHGKPSYLFSCDCGSEFAGRWFETINRRAEPKCKECLRTALKGAPRPGARVSPADRTINVAWYGFKKASNNKGGLFLSREHWFDLTQRDCTYCESPPSNVWRAPEIWAEDFTYQGIDRVDSSIGYTPENVRPCCWVCNRMKGNMTEEEFIAHLRKILNHVGDSR